MKNPAQDWCVPFTRPLNYWEGQRPRTGGSVGWASGCYAGGREFDFDRTNAQGHKNNWGESAAFVITSANG